MSIHPFSSPPSKTILPSNSRQVSPQHSSADISKEELGDTVTLGNQVPEASLQAPPPRRPKTSRLRNLLHALGSCYGTSTNQTETEERVILKNPRNLILQIMQGKKWQALRAIKKGDIDLDQVSIGGLTALDAAITQNSKKVAQALITAGVNVNRPNAFGKTPIQAAAQSGHLEILNMLLASSRANIDATDNLGRTAAHNAVQGNQLRILQALIAANADLSLPDHFGKTSLHTAAESGRNQCAALLLNVNVAINPLDPFGHTPLDNVCWANFTPERLATLKLLLQHGAEPGQTPHRSLLIIPNRTLQTLEKLRIQLAQNEQPDRELIQLLDDRVPTWKAAFNDNRKNESPLLDGAS